MEPTKSELKLVKMLPDLLPMAMFMLIPGEGNPKLTAKSYTPPNEQVQIASRTSLA
jgi:hypothetical protein